jgi:UTP--glucose-1-phosphate uridylyltransferase
MSDDGLTAAEQKMRDAGQPEEAIRSFASAYRRLQSGESAMLPSAELEPAGDVDTLEDLPEADTGSLDRVAVVKLNGGLATSMGLRSPKSLVEARDGLSFLDIIIGNTLALRRRYGVRLPLVLMNSQATRAETTRALESHPDLDTGLPVHFLQSMEPKLDAESLAPVSWAREPSLEWCPPGHGDVYSSLRSSGMLDALLNDGFRYAMISNADNLGATPDARIAGYLERSEIPFLMEVVEGTEADRKGGHIARRRADGQLVLRETAQTPEEDQESFRDYRRWRYYNTNSLWVDLRGLKEKLDETGGVLELPLIINRKTVDPRDPSSPPVIQLESAMGAGIGSFKGAQLLCVPRTRFVPVKTTDDLLVLRSDVYTLSDDLAVSAVPERVGNLPYVELDPHFYKLLDDFEKRFPGGAPSLRKADRLVVRGDVTFGEGVRVCGAVELDVDVPTSIDAGTTLEPSASRSD